MANSVMNKGQRWFKISPPLALMTILSTLGGYLGTSSGSLAQSIFEDISINPRSADLPITIRGISGGLIPARQVAELQETETGSCVGFVDQEPDHTITLNTFADFLRLQIRSPEDTTLVIKGPGGIWCNDDAEGSKNPGIAGQWLPGSYELWIGSYQKNKYYPYVIEINQAQE